MSLKAFLTRELTQYLRIRCVLTHRSYATVSDAAKPEDIDITSVDTQPKYEEDLGIDERTLDAMRNKSRLNSSHRNILQGRRPYEKPGIARHHGTLMFNRRMLGRFGIEGSAVPPGVAWPTKDEITMLKEFERVSYPQTIQESWAMLEAEKKKEAEQMQAREDEVVAKLAKTAQWEKELYNKIAKKEAAAQDVAERKARMVEEVRRHFGFKVDPRDERFKEMLEMKEKEDKKRRKEAKKKERADKLMEKMLKGRPSPGNAESPDAQDNQGKTKPPADLA